MKIEIRNLKFSTVDSRETNGFEATVYIDGERVGTARNKGFGGSTHIEPHEVETRLNTYAATLSKVVSSIEDKNDPSGFFTYAATGETLVGDLVQEALVARELKKALGKRVLYTVANKPGIFQTNVLKADVLARTLKDSALAQRLKATTILNLLPWEKALRLYKAGTCSAPSGA